MGARGLNAPPKVSSSSCPVSSSRLSKPPAHRPSLSPKAPASVGELPAGPGSDEAHGSDDDDPEPPVVSAAGGPQVPEMLPNMCSIWWRSTTAAGQARALATEVTTPSVPCGSTNGRAERAAPVCRAPLVLTSESGGEMLMCGSGAAESDRYFFSPRIFSPRAAG
jgi:hypothetical protein